MAFRLVSKRLLARQVPTFTSRAFSASAATTEAPTVFENLIKLTIVDPSGARRQIPAMVGKYHNILLNTRRSYFTHLIYGFKIGTTLYEACETNEVELGPMTMCGPSQIVHSERWTEPVFGDGPTSGYDHVVLSGPGVDTAAPMTHAEERMIEDYWDFDEIYPESRLASMIKLTKGMDGMIVFVPPRVDDSNP